MTENATEANVIQGTPLVQNAIYSHYGLVRIAVNESHLMDIVGTDGQRHMPNADTELLEMPGTEGWVDRMVRARNALVTDLRNTRAEVISLNTRWENLGEAILEEAINRDWCGEYDAFAEEWGLPTRARDYEVTMTVTVKARDEDAAIAMVRDQVSIDRWSTEGIDEDPEYTVSEA